jgi:putative ABC transport system permease protein
MRRRSERPSRLGYRFLSRLLDRSEHFTMIGDLEEIRADMAKEKGASAARLWFWGQIVRALPSYLGHLVYWSTAMFKNYFITSLRNIRKQKGHTLINVSGLAIGLAACLLAIIYVRDELSYDRYNTNADRISRITARVLREGREMLISGAGAPAAPALKEGFPEVEDAVRFRESTSIRVKAGEISFREQRVVYTEPSFFKIFTVPLLSGDPETALQARRTLVLSRTTAAKYFGKENPVGKTLRIDGEEDWQVTGVFEDIPQNSHFHFDIMRSFSSLEVEKDPLEGSWMSFNFQTYILFREGASSRELEAKLPSLITSHMAPEIKQTMGVSLDEFLTKSGMKIDYNLQPLTDIHLRSNAGIAEFEPNSDIKYITLFSAVSIFILLLAGINFVNLATARSAGRAREVGIRKVLGSVRRDLIAQFLLESTILSLTALVFAGLLVGVALPLFNQLSGKEMTMRSLTEPATAAAAVILTLVIGILAGAYPAFFISAFRPSPILQGRLAKGIKGGVLRRVLVVFQFAVSASLIVGTFVVFNQLHYIQTRKIGFNRDQVLILRNAYLLGDQAETLKEEMLRYPQVLKASLSSFLPVPSSRARLPVARESDPDSQNALPISVWTVDQDYLETLEMKTESGRNFSPEMSTDAEAVLINQAAVRHFGFDNPLGQGLVLVDLSPNSSGMRRQPYTVIGVVEDFHYESLRHRIEPLMIRLGRSRGTLLLRVQAADVAGTIETLRQKWTSLAPGEPFEYSFLDESFNDMYRAEVRIGRIFGAFAGLAVFIGCLGLFGLAAFSAAKRAKEIGIHKVFGASIPEIFRLLVKEYVLLIAVANIIAWPVASIFMLGWLRQFAYRTELGWAVFVGTGLATLFIALLAVSAQSLKAATANPAETLKYE